MKKVSLVLIHNNNHERYQYIFSEIKFLKEWLANEKFDTNFFEVSYQSVIVPHGRLMSFLRDVIYQVVAVEWARYRRIRVSFASSLRHVLNLVSRGDRYSVGGSWRRSSAIEVAVTDKHIRAWSKFLDADSDFIIVFEDDAIFNADSKQRLSKLLKQLMHENSDRSIYVDLAGGCSVDALHLDKILESKNESFRHYEKPATNTACAYLMNKSLVAEFHKVLTRRPWLRLIGVDWMMNALFMSLVREGLNCICMHAEPTIFKHGSTTGEYLPWIR